MKISIFILLVSLGIAFISCDRQNLIHYTVENKTGDSIKFIYSFGENYFDNQATDTTIVLKSNQKDTIFTFTQISPSVYDPEDGNTMIYIIHVDVTRLRDHAKIKKDASLRKNWIYRETGRNEAIMAFTITDADF